MKHTKGPWMIKHDGDAIQIGQIKSGRFIAMALPCESDVATEEDYANAQLIAAAPELLEACDKVLSMLDPSNRREDKMWNILYDAIDKAQGR